jgi:ATP-dependent RNA helicase RhlE
MTGDAFTFVAPEESADLKAIERAVGKALPRVTLPDFDYAARPQAKLEIPIAERIAEIRRRKSDERSRRAAKGRPPSAGPHRAAGPHRPGGSHRPGGPQRPAGPHRRRSPR